MKIVLFPDPILLNPAEPCEFPFDLEFIQKMDYLRRKNNGLGLAAPQVGLGKRMFVISPSLGTHYIAYFNPKVEDRSGPIEARKEGCLSLPGVNVDIPRHRCITLSFYTERGNRYEANYEGLAARVIQHEVDHLDGVLLPT